MKNNCLIIGIVAIAFALFSVSIANAVTIIGDDLINRGSNDGASGQVYIYNGDFGTDGVATTFSFFDDDNFAPDRLLTPLLFEKTSGTDFILKGIGTTRTSTESGIQSSSFGLIAGTDVVTSGYTFGFTDRALSWNGSNVVNGSQNAGVVDFNGGGNWYFTPTQTFDIELGKLFRVAGTTGGNEVRLYEFGTRTYSAQITAEVVPEPTTIALLGIGLAGFAGIAVRRRLKKSK